MGSVRQIWIKGCTGKTYSIACAEKIVFCEKPEDRKIVASATPDNIIRGGKRFSVKGNCIGAAKFIAAKFCGETGYIYDFLTEFPAGVEHTFFLREKGLEGKKVK
jgi:hypothetical protein